MPLQSYYIYILNASYFKQTIDYWPDTSEVVHQEYGLITVTVRKRIVKPDYTITTFRLVHAAVSIASLLKKCIIQIAMLIGGGT